MEQILSFYDQISIILGVALTSLAIGLLLAEKGGKSVEKIMPVLVSISCGLLLGICFSQFLPRAFESHSNWTPFLIFLGLVSVILSERFVAPWISRRSDHSCEHLHDHNLDNSPSVISRQAACSSIGCILVCAFFDGIDVQASFQLSKEAGWIVGSSMLLHTIPEGALAASIALAGGLSKRSAKSGVILVSLALVLGASFSTALSYLLDFNKIILPFVSGVLIYVSLGHLMPAVLKTRYGIYGVVFGALLITLIGQHLGHSH